MYTGEFKRAALGNDKKGHAIGAIRGGNGPVSKGFESGNSPKTIGECGIWSDLWFRKKVQKSSKTCDIKHEIGEKKQH